MIEVENLRKQYGDLVAVDGVSFEAKPGEIFGLLGPNGAGKSTTIGCISGLHAPTSGRVRLLGHDVVTEPVKSRRRLGVVPQELALYEDLPARTNLEFWGSMYGLGGKELSRRVDEVLTLIGLLDRAGDVVSQFSGGMKRRLNFGCALVHQPEVLLLDEPTVGVDPQSRERLLDMVREQTAAGTCVLYTTHYMEEAEALCDRLAIIDHGEIIASGTLEELHRMHGERDLLRLTGRFAPPAIHAWAVGLPEDWAGLEVVAVEEESLTLAVPQASARLPALFAGLAETGAEIRETTLGRPSLESLFIKLTGKELRQ
jgi:ABC-2 type transport system ATP-binding protein